MKKILLGFILGVVAIVSLAASPIGESLMTIKPATPKSTVVIECRWGDIDSKKEVILKYAKQGYVPMSTVSVDTRALVIMGKY